MTTKDTLKELREMFPDEFVRVRSDTEFWPLGVGNGPE